MERSVSNGNSSSQRLVTPVSSRVCLFTPSAARAEPSEDERSLIAFLQKECAAGFFTIGNRGQDASGAFKWGATFHRELRKPLEKLTAHCAAGGDMTQLASLQGLYGKQRFHGQNVNIGIKRLPGDTDTRFPY